MENTMAAMAGGAILLFLVCVALTAVLVAASSLIGLFGAAAYLLNALAGRTWRVGALSPKPVKVI